MGAEGIRQSCGPCVPRPGCCKAPRHSFHGLEAGKSGELREQDPEISWLQTTRPLCSTVSPEGREKKESLIECPEAGAPHLGCNTGADPLSPRRLPNFPWREGGFATSRRLLLFIKRGRGVAKGEICLWAVHFFQGLVAFVTAYSVDKNFCYKLTKPAVKTQPGAMRPA